MSLLGHAALAMWWNVSGDVRAEFEDWHTHEHFPERLGIRGFLRASRWRSADGEGGFFVLKAVAQAEASADALIAAGAARGALGGLYVLSCSATPADVA